MATNTPTGNEGYERVIKRKQVSLVVQGPSAKLAAQVKRLQAICVDRDEAYAENRLSDQEYIQSIRDTQNLVNSVEAEINQLRGRIRGTSRNNRRPQKNKGPKPSQARPAAASASNGQSQNPVKKGSESAEKNKQTPPAREKVVVKSKKKTTTRKKPTTKKKAAAKEKAPATA